MLDGSLDGTRSELRFVAFACQQVDGLVGDVEGDAVLAQQLADILHLQADNLLHFAPVEGMEDDDFVDTVQELGADAALDEQVAHIFSPLGEVCPGEQVARHDDDGVLEVDGAALGVGQTSVVEHLQQGVEDVGVRLLYLIEEDDLVRLAPDGLGELSALVVADVSWRCADEPCHAELLLILAHVDAGHHRLVVEEVLCQRLGELRLAHACGAEEDEGAAWGPADRRGCGARHC